MLAALLLANISVTVFATRVALVGALGLLSALEVHGSYWNWYGFPADYTLAASVDLVIGWLLVGVTLAMILKPAGR